VALAAGMSLAEVAVMVRHASANVTATVYAGLADDGREKAAAREGGGEARRGRVRALETRTSVHRLPSQVSRCVDLG